MNFDNQTTAGCIVPPAPVQDPRCLDAAFALSHPSLCANVVSLILKPETALICRLGSISFRVFEYRTGVETEVLDNITFTSSDNSVFAIGVHSGSGTGLAEGVVTITAARNGLSATADVTVLAENTCCDDTNVASSILIDNSRSMSLQFGGAYGTRLVFAKAAALLYGNPILLANGLPKDKIKVWSFNDAPTQISADFIQVDATVASQIAGVQQSLNKTDLLEALTSAVDDMLNATADEKILVLVSDGEETTITNRQAILDYGALFKAAGGIIIVVAPRASGTGYDLLERLATGGFFLNAISTNAADVLDELSYIKSILCVGRCVTAGDEYVPTPQLNFSSFSNWEVTSGQVNLIGNGLLDIQPGNGLYVDLNGGTAGVMRTIDTFALVSGRTYRIAFDVAGNNRLDSPGANQALKAYLRDIAANDSDPNIFDHTVSPAWDSPFATYSFTFVAPYNVTVRLYFEQLVSSGFAGTWHGNLLDYVVLDDVTTQVTLLSDNFDNENRQYVPPNCGTGVFPIESGIEYVQTGAGSGININLVPDMTSATAPSGTVTASSNNGYSFGGHDYYFPWMVFDRVIPDLDWFSENPLPDENAAWHQWLSSSLSSNGGSQWVQYQFPIADTVLSYVINAMVTLNGVGNPVGDAQNYPIDFTLKGSNDGVAWTTLDTQTGITWGTGVTRKEFTISSPASYAYYRFTATSVQGGAGGYLGLNELELMGESDAAPAYEYIPTYEFITNTDCYTECNSSTPGTQSVDPSPLPDIESNYTPPITFTSTKTVCATCDEGFVNVSDTNLVPAMTSNTAPSGTASASDNNANAYKGFDGIATYSPLSAYESVATPCWLRFQLPAAKTVAMYAITAWKQAGSPKTWTFEASLDGTTWVEKDSQTNITWFPGERKMFLAPNTTAYAYYRLNVSDSPPDSEGGDSTVINELELYEAAEQSVCATATEISYVSQGAADAAATAAALAAAQAGLNCVATHTETRSYTATCPTNQYGIPVTKSVTKVSLVSAEEAGSAASVEAQALAEAELDCGLSNNSERIVLNDKTGADMARSTAYPSVRFIENVVGLVTNVTVTLTGFSHNSPDDIHVILVSPSGEKVSLMRNCGGTNSASNLNFTFSDAAGSFLSDAGALSSGTFKPSNYGSVVSLPSPCLAAPYSSLLSDFIGINPNGAWSLWCADDSALDAGEIASGWDISITAV